MNSKTSVYTSQFWKLCVSSLLFFASFNMIIPELPDYLTSLGGGDYKGLIIALFTLTAMVSRPFSGKLTDRIGRMPVILFGTAVCLVCSLIYPLVTTLAGFFLLRLLHGFSTGFSPTGSAAYLADIIPADRRGEAVGILGTAGTVGMALGPTIGGAVANKLGLNSMFYCSSLFAFASIAILLRTKETLPHKEKVTWKHLQIRREDLFEPRVWKPCLVMALAAFAYGVVYTLIPDFGREVGIKNKGLLFGFFTLASLAVRLLAGKASDRYGRLPVLKISTLFITTGMIMVALATTQWMLIGGVMIYGLGQGATSPTLLAWATDLSAAGNKGRGISSLYIFMELGIGLGALLSGWIYGNESSNLTTSFWVSASLSFAAFTYLFVPFKNTAS